MTAAGERPYVPTTTNPETRSVGSSSVTGGAPYLHPTEATSLLVSASRRLHDGKKTETTLNNGYLGSRNDEERSEMRYVV